MIRKISVLVCILFFSILASSYAEDGTIVVTATRNEAKILKTPSKVNIITSKQLKNEGVIYVKDALKSIPGISVVSNGVFGGTTSVYSRGLPSYYTKILIDGVDVSDPSLAQPKFDLANLTVDDIQRIEIVQGAQSGLYGSNAIGGVINIITKKALKKPYFKYSQKVGSYATYKETAQGGGSLGRFNLYLEASRFDTNGISKMDKYNPKSRSYSRGDEDDSYHKTSFSTRIEYKLDNSLKVGGIFKWYKTRDYLDNGWYVTPSYDYLPDDSAKSNNTPQASSLRDTNDFLLSKLYIHKRFGALGLKLDTFFVQNLRYYKSAPPYWNDYKGRRWGFDAIATYKIKETTLTGGFTQKTEKYEDSSPFKKLRYNYAGFMEIEHRIKNLTLQAVVREDEYKTFGKHFTYKLGANYLISPTNTVLKANFSTGFRAPSIWELYAAPNPSWWFLGGNDKLKPEKASTWDFGFIQGFMQNRLSFGAIYFKSIVKDRIEYYTNASYKSTYENVNGKTIADGVELNLNAKPMEFVNIGLNYTYTASKNPKTNEQSARIPLRVYNGYVSVESLNGKIISTLEGRYVGKRFDDSKHKYQTGKYAVFNFTTRYLLNKNLNVSLSIKNIFDRFYEEVYGYSTLPRSVFATISYKF